MFYFNFVNLCNSVNKSPSAVAEEMGFKRSVVTAWKNGRQPRQATLQKIADYFGVSVDDLIAESEKTATHTDDGKDLEDLIRLYKAAPAWLQLQARSLLEAGAQSVGIPLDTDSKD